MIKLTSEDFNGQQDHWLHQVACEHETLLVQGREGNAVLISEEDWNAINDILQVVSMSGMAESIRSGLQEEIDVTADHID